ncbi:MAG: LON peptidase substrate-binding domain-containing protein [Gemmatimonadota bacterium]
MRRLPLFILPVVLLPGTLMPLHVFEPRYRQMVARCLEGDKRFGVLYHDAQRLGDFQIQIGRVGCVAEILGFQPLPDGRSVILARGVARFRVLDGIESDTLFHEALVEIVRDEEEFHVALRARRDRSLSLFAAAVRRLGGPGKAVPELQTGQDLSWQLAGAVDIDPTWKQRLLELRAESARLDEIDSVLRSVAEEEP